MDEEVKRHPAKFSQAVLEEVNEWLSKDHHPSVDNVKFLYDPFAGIGKVFELDRGEKGNLWVFGTEIEKEWAKQVDRPEMVCMDAFKYMEMTRDGWFDYVCTSPTYGNRMADHHEAKDGSKRHTYRHYLGRMPSEGSSSTMQWGDRYREFHRRAWRECYRIIRPGGAIILNVKDHVRKGNRQLVVDWHIDTLDKVGFEVEGASRVETPGMRHGENGEARVDGEWIVIARKK